MRKLPPIVRVSCLMVRRLMSSQVVEEAENQRENILHSRCLVMGKLCPIIIDGGSSVNVVSLRLLEKLNIPTFFIQNLINYNDLVKGVNKKVALAFTLESSPPYVTRS
ncbi:hypothetical protein CR513_15725, partial [Mucuna pruriens]